MATADMIQTPSGSASSQGERLATIEAERRHLATRADLRELETRMIKWMVAQFLILAGILAGIVVPLLIHIIGRLPQIP